VRRRFAEAAAIEGTGGERPRRSASTEWAWLDLNLGPHRYQVLGAQRCTDRRFPTSLATVRGEGMRT
jgi:hypothetical protein